MCGLADGIMAGALGYCAWLDWKTRELPVVVLITFSVLSCILAMGSGESMASMSGGVLIGVLFFVVSKLSKEAIGYGDSWIILLLGIYLGGEKLVFALSLASFCAGISSLLYLWKYEWKKTKTLPFVPFLAIGYLGVLLL